jgi:hypothetical protein
MVISGARHSDRASELKGRTERIAIPARDPSRADGEGFRRVARHPLKNAPYGDTNGAAAEHLSSHKLQLKDFEAQGQAVTIDAKGHATAGLRLMQ